MPIWTRYLKRRAGSLRIGNVGIVLLAPRTGGKDDTNAVVDMKLLGLVAKTSGVEVKEYVSLPIDADNRVQFGLPNLEGNFPASVWADVLDLRGAEAIAWNTDTTMLINPRLP